MDAAGAAGVRAITWNFRSEVDTSLARFKSPVTVRSLLSLVSTSDMRPPPIVVIGGSTGALEALATITAGLPPQLDAAIFVVIHTARDTPGVLDILLTRRGLLPAHYAVDGETFRAAEIYLAPPDRHLIVKRDHVKLTRGPKENRFRPAIDPLFRTAARSHGARVVGVVLSGGLDDGSVGLAAIKAHGGIAIVQDPNDALAPSMPTAASRHIKVDYSASSSQLAPVLIEAIERINSQPHVPMPEKVPPDVSEIGRDAIHHADRVKPPSPFTCPDCGGALWQSREGELLQFQCHVGHRFSGDGLTSAQAEDVDGALWVALRTIEESIELRRRMARSAKERGMDVIAADYLDQARESELRADVIRGVLMPEAHRHSHSEREPEPAGTIERAD